MANRIARTIVRERVRGLEPDTPKRAGKAAQPQPFPTESLKSVYEPRKAPQELFTRAKERLANVLGEAASNLGLGPVTPDQKRRFLNQLDKLEKRLGRAVTMYAATSTISAAATVALGAAAGTGALGLPIAGGLLLASSAGFGVSAWRAHRASLATEEVEQKRANVEKFTEEYNVAFYKFRNHKSRVKQPGMVNHSDAMLHQALNRSA